MDDLISRNVPTGWLSPEGKLYDCDYYEHIGLAREIAEKSGASDEEMWTAEDYLFKHGWVRISMIVFLDHGFVVSFPSSRTISQEQRQFLKPYVENDISIFSKLANTDLMLEFEEFFYSDGERKANG